jgi:hypothetical protein
MTGESILRTLVELLAEQEQLKITYEIKSNKGTLNGLDNKNELLHT